MESFRERVPRMNRTTLRVVLRDHGLLKGRERLGLKRLREAVLREMDAGSITHLQCPAPPISLDMSRALAEALQEWGKEMNKEITRL